MRISMFWIFLVQVLSLFVYGSETSNFDGQYQPVPRQPVDIITDVINDLGVRILQQYTTNGNVAFSPTGVGFILAALYEGSFGRGRQQIVNALGLPRDIDVTRIGFRDIHRRLRTYLNADGFLGGLILNRENTRLRPEYEEILRFYGFDLSGIDEASNATASMPEATTTDNTSEEPIPEMTTEMIEETTMSITMESASDETTPVNDETEAQTEAPASITSSVEFVGTTLSTMDQQEKLTEITSTASTILMEAPREVQTSSPTTLQTSEEDKVSSELADSSSPDSASTTMFDQTTSSTELDSTTLNAVEEDATDSCMECMESSMAGNSSPENVDSNQVTGTTASDVMEVSTADSTSTTSASVMTASGSGEEDLTASGSPTAVASEIPVSSATGSEKSGVEMTVPPSTGSEIPGSTIAESEISGIKMTGSEVTGPILTASEMTVPPSTGSEMTGSASAAPEIPGSITAESEMSGIEMTELPSTGSEITGSVSSSPEITGPTTTELEMYGAEMTGSEMIASTLPKSEMAVPSSRGSEITGSAASGPTTGSEISGTTIAGSKVPDLFTPGSEMFESAMTGFEVSGFEMSGLTSIGSEVTGSRSSEQEFTGSTLTASQISGPTNTGLETTGSEIGGPGPSSAGVEITASTSNELAPGSSIGTSITSSGATELPTASTTATLDNEVTMSMKTGSASSESTTINSMKVATNLVNDMLPELNRDQFAGPPADGDTVSTDLSSKETMTDTSQIGSADLPSTDMMEDQATTETSQESSTLSPSSSEESMNNVRKRSARSLRGYFSSYPDDGTWMQKLGIWKSHAPSMSEAMVRDSTEIQFLVNGCDVTSVSAGRYIAVLPFAYFPSLHALALEFPLDDPRYNILLVMSTDRRDTYRLARDLGGKSLRLLRKQLQPTWVRATIPSFMLHGFVTLTGFLQRLGISDVFNPRTAELSLMTPDPGVYARDVQQSISVNIRNYMRPDRTHSRNGLFERAGPVPFTAVHPFLYFIVDAETSVALIAGRVNDPHNARIL